MQRTLPYFGFLCTGLVLLGVMTGCSDSGPHIVNVHGNVSWEGQPVPLGTVSLVPARGAATGLARPAVGQLQPDGSYTIRAFPDRDGALPGQYQVAVISYTGSLADGSAKYIVPERFANPTSSGLTASIPPDADGPIRLDFALSE